MEIEIMNLRFEKPSRPYDFYIDHRSPVGNPFHKTKGVMDLKVRDAVCEGYDGFFKLALKDNEGIKAWLKTVGESLEKHGQVRLFCWCVPLRCHGETIKKWLEEKYENQEEEA